MHSAPERAGSLSAYFHVSSGEAHLQCRALPAAAVFFEAGGQRPNAGVQRHQRDGFQRAARMLLSDHFMHPGREMAHGQLQRHEIGQ